MSDENYTVFYDGQCPMCSREINWLKSRDRDNRLNAIDISAADFNAGRYGLDTAAVNLYIHGITSDGRTITGVEALTEAYRAVRLGWLVAPLSWPGFHWLAGFFYERFARNRKRIGFFIFGPKCDDNCSMPGN